MAAGLPDLSNLFFFFCPSLVIKGTFTDIGTSYIVFIINSILVIYLHLHIPLSFRALRPAVLGLTGARQKHTLPDLPYDYNGLEPYISAEIMQIHHAKHHNTYVTNLNVTEEKMAEAKEKSRFIKRRSSRLPLL